MHTYTYMPIHTYLSLEAIDMCELPLMSTQGRILLLERYLPMAH